MITTLLAFTARLEVGLPVSTNTVFPGQHAYKRLTLQRTK